MCIRDRIKTAQRQMAGRSDRLAASPGETVRQWLIHNGQTPRVCEMLWEPLALAALNQPAEIAAAPAFARVLAEMFTNDPRAAAIVLPTRPLDQMYAEPARAFIEQRGGLVTTGTARIVIKADRVASVVCGAETWTPGAAISAVPWFALRAAFEGDVAPLEPIFHAADATDASPIVTVNLWFDRPVLEEPFVGLPGRVMQWVFDKRLILGGETSHLTLVSSGAADVVRRTNDELIALACDELREALPAVWAATMVKGTVIREPRASFSLAPGQPARPATTTAVKGLALAGDWIDTGLPATIEGAVRSGHLAAHAVLP